MKFGQFSSNFIPNIHKYHVKFVSNSSQNSRFHQDDDRLKQVDFRTASIGIQSVIGNDTLTNKMNKNTNNINNTNTKII